jgi:hypothetical protein
VNLFDQLNARKLFQNRQIEFIDYPRVQLELFLNERGPLIDEVSVERLGICAPPFSGVTICMTIRILGQISVNQARRNTGQKTHGTPPLRDGSLGCPGA